MNQRVYINRHSIYLNKLLLKKKNYIPHNYTYNYNQYFDLITKLSMKGVYAIDCN